MFQLVLRLLLQRQPGGHRYSKGDLQQRFRLFDGGKRAQLHEKVVETAVGPRLRMKVSDEEVQAKAYETACQLVKQGEVSHARQRLIGMSLAPEDGETLRQLKNTNARPDRLTEELPEELYRRTVQLCVTSGRAVRQKPFTQ